MKRTSLLAVLAPVCGVLALLILLPAPALADGFKLVSGPGADPECFKAWTPTTQYLQFPKKQGPYRIALDNGFIGNGWRIQMIQSAKAYAAQPEVKAQLKEFKVISTGEDLPAQIAAANNFIDAGYDAVIVNALNPTAFAPVAKRAKKAGVVLLSFDNVIESPDNITVNVDQVQLGKIAARWLLKEIGTASAGGVGSAATGDAGGGLRLLEIRGPSGNSVDRDRHQGFHEVLDKSGRKFEVVEVVGKWDDGTGQKAAADAIAVHKHFDGVYTQGGSTGAVRALLDSGHPMIPIAGETENGFRKLCEQYASKGLHCSSAGTGPAQVAVTIKAALTALNGEKVPQSIALPTSYVEYPNIKAGTDFYPDLADSFFVGNSFEACKIGFTAQEIMAKTGKNE
jgi:ribose transport system substrate-binding protein